MQIEVNINGYKKWTVHKHKTNNSCYQPKLQIMNKGSNKKTSSTLKYFLLQQHVLTFSS